MVKEGVKTRCLRLEHPVTLWNYMTCMTSTAVMCRHFFNNHRIAIHEHTPVPHAHPCPRRWHLHTDQTQTGQFHRGTVPDCHWPDRHFWPGAFWFAFVSSDCPI